MAEFVLTRDSRDPLAGLTREQFESELTAQLVGRVEQVWVFGSYASGQLGPQSDVDLILVCSTTLPFPIRSREFADLLDIGPRLDLLVYTPDEFTLLTTNPTVGFWQRVIGSLRRLA